MRLLRNFSTHWHIPVSKKRETRCTSCSCADALSSGFVRTLIAHVGRPLADCSDLQAAARERAEGEAAAPRRSHGQPGRARAAGNPPGADAKHAEAALPRPTARHLR